MVHLPALTMTGNIRKVLNIVNNLGMSIRGVYGENSKIEGCMYQISNTQTLGITENDIVKNLNLNATIVNTSKNGMLVNKNCGAAHIEFLKEFSKNKNFDACFSFDGDADRIIMLDNFNEVRDGDDILFALSKAYKKQGKLKGEIVATDFSNFGLDASLKKLNIEVFLYSINKKDKPELKEVKDEIIEKIVKEKMDNDKNIQTEALVELRKKYNLEINDKDIKKSYNTSVKEALAKNENSSN